jgi:phosphoenolpyruvate-protein kinase (PTS system EI component)
LAPLLWDAAALVTAGGGPAAHLFESARALGIPAIAGADLAEALGHDADEPPGGRDTVAAVDGDMGTVAVDRW